MIRAAGLLLAVLLLAGCGVRPTGVVYAGDAPTATASGSPLSQVFYLSEDFAPVPVQRSVSPADPQRVFDALLSGPTQDERARGLATDLSGIKRILVHDLDGQTLLIQTAPPTAKVTPWGYAQIYCTGLMLSARAVVKISFLNDGATAYRPPACAGQGPVDSTAAPSGGVQK